jgi:hypothetical protein
MRKKLSFLLIGCLAMLTGCTVYEDVDPHLSGWRSPSLSAPDQFGRKINLKQATSGPWAVVFFYPKADTPG